MKQSTSASTWLSRFTAIILTSLMTLFFAITINNMMTIGSQVDRTKNGPYPVSVAAGRVETLLVQCRTLADRPLFARAESAIDDIERSYAAADADLREKISFIAAAHDADLDAARKLEQGYESLDTVQKEYVALCRNASATDEQIAAFVNNTIDPAVNDLLRINSGILDESTEAVGQLYNVVTDRGRQTVGWAVVLMAGVAVSLAVYLTLMYRNRKREDRLKADLQEALSLAQTASAAKSQFLSNMSHDIRTPMNAIVGLTTIAKAHLHEPERMAACLDRIQSSSRHLLSLINDVLDMGKIESGKIVLNEDRFSFPDFVNGVIAIAQPQAKAKNLSLDITVGTIQQENVVGDAMRLNQALINLVSNAVKYTPDGGSIRLSLSERPSRRPGCHDYRFVVQDTGLGMSPEFLERLFDPFEREESDATKRIEGTGLGMAITKNVVDMMGGSIEVESTPGEGSTFIMTVPLQPLDEEEDFSLEGLEEARVLLVDDDPDVIEGTLLILDELGLCGDAASSGFDAVPLVERAHHEGHDYRFIIVDWVMPGMDGIETIRRIRSEVGDSTPIVLLTAYDWHEIEEEARAAGVSAFVSKPLFKSRLHHVLKLFSHPSGPAESPCPPTEVHLEGRVLVVEDNLLNLEIATELIQGLGADVDQAINGQKAVNAMANTPEGYYDLVFMDMQMPVMGGVEATRAIREQERTGGRKPVPIVAMTANAFNEDRERALAAGMDGFMTKPIDLAKLKRILEEYLAKP
ncbi:response regulator [Gordonibacter pamelaeae]|uniref:response regulator n=1 Tax=Gordonibacter pamelaeae TaxID=471189 RepID=UPI00242BA6AF|nr:response regulator [Gordonibacter pamelaeae]